MHSSVLKEKATLLRKKGFTYKEILEEVPVAKSTLSTWLIEMPLTAKEKNVLKKRRDNNISLGRIRAAASLHALKIERNNELLAVSKIKYAQYRSDPFFYIGLSLYWAEGSKRSTTFTFINSDSDMITMMLEWIERFFQIPRDAVRARLYIHKPYAHEDCESYWAKVTGIPSENFRTTIYKPTDLLVKKRPGYKGCLRIEVGKVLYLRMYLFWQQMLLDEYRKQR